MTTANQSAAERNITLVSVANIQPSNYNPRKRFDETGLDELAESIKQQGVLQPITVRPIADTDRYEIVFGERRYRASVIAGLEEVPAIISELSDEEAQEMAVTENLQRKDVTPTEEAQGRRIKNYFPVKVVTNIFHPIPLLVFSDSCFLLLFSHSLVW